MAKETAEHIMGKDLLTMLEGQEIFLPARPGILYNTPKSWKVQKVLLEWPLAAVGKGGRQPDVVLVDDKGRMLAVEIANTNSKRGNQPYWNDLRQWGLLTIEVDVKAGLKRDPPMLSMALPGAQLLRNAGKWIYPGEPGKLIWLAFEGDVPLSLILGHILRGDNSNQVGFALIVQHGWPTFDEEDTGFHLSADGSFIGKPSRNWKWRFFDANPAYAAQLFKVPEKLSIGQACKFIKEQIKIGEGLDRIEPPKLPPRWIDQPDSDWWGSQECVLKWKESKPTASIS